MDTMERFWEKWIKADSIKKEELLWPVVQMILEHDNLPKKMRERSLKMCMNGYFEDLYYVAYADAVKEKKK